MSTLINTTNKNIPITKKDGGSYLLAPRCKKTVDPANYDKVPKGVVLK